MKLKLSLFIFIALFLILSVSLFSFQGLFAQNYDKNDEKIVKENLKRKKFLLEMQNFLNAAVKSGFREDEIREITVVRDGKVIYVWDFLENEKLRLKKEKLADKKTKPLERYLTVMDISDELESRETKDLDVLKEKSIFVGAEQE